MSIYSDFFDSSKTFKPQIVATGLVNGRLIADSESEEEEEDLDPTDKGLDYVEEYQKKELATYDQMGFKVTNTMSCIESATSLIPPEEKAEYFEFQEEAKARVYSMYQFTTRTRMDFMPIDGYKQTILNMLNTSSTIIIHGPTGCGKTTQVPQIILDHCRENNQPCNIVVTQPRRIAALSVAKRVCEERGWALGTVCGYQVGLVKQVNPDTILTYVTTGVLLQKLANKKHMNEYTHILIDEVHERTQEMDFLLLLIRRFLYTNSQNVKVILMSATFDTDKFGKYFSTHSAGQQIPAPTVFVTKESNFVTCFYYVDQLASLGKIPEFNVDDPGISPDLYKILANLIKIFDKLDERIEGSDQSIVGNVLVFLPGIFEIEEAYAYLNEARRSDVLTTNWNILPLHSSITSDEQRKVFISPPLGTRKIILSTNLAESSITVTDIEYVIDFCLTKTMTVDSVTQYQSLKLEWASKVNCIQRSGRVGRVRDGRVYRMVPERFYDNCLASEIEPEMHRAPLERIVLCSKLLDLHEPPKAILALAIDPPRLENIESTLFNLKEAGALLTTTNGEVMKSNGDLTFLGRIMAALPLDVKLSKLICLGHMFSCLQECVIMAAGCSLSNIFSSPFQEKLKSYINRLIWADGSSSDLIAYLNLYRVWERNSAGAFKETSQRMAWCTQNYLSLRSIREWEILVMEINQRLLNMGIKETVGPGHTALSHYELPLILKVVISGAFYPNYFQRSNDSNQIDEREAVKLLNGLNPLQTVYFTNMDTTQPGPLYTKRIKEILKTCSSSMKVYFTTTSKIFVTFPASPDPHTININGQQYVASVPGKVSFDVYKAIRLRQIRFPTTICVLSSRESWQRAKECGIATCSEWGNYKLIKNTKTSRTTILPGLHDITITIRITHVVNAGNFYAQPASEEIDRQLATIDEILNPKGSFLIPLTQPPVVGNLYAAIFKDDGRYYRCKLIALIPYRKNEILAQILYVDFGNNATVLHTSLRTIPRGIAETMAPLAMECVLSQVQPSVILNPKALWSERADAILKNAMPNTLAAKVYSVVDDIVSVELFKENGLISINQFLISKQFAQAAEESYLSKENNQKRLKAQNYNDTEMEIEDAPVATIGKDVEPPPLHECTERINLKGPHSPLEMSIFSFFDTQKVNIDGNSVNAVLLDAEPQDSHERLLVAVNVSQSPHSASLTLRHTTLMPNVHGFATLMALLFCPKMAPKPVEDGSCIGAFLCGLGENPNSNKPLYGVHDVIMTVDTEIDTDDLVQINEIRYWLNNTVNSMEMIYNNTTPTAEMEICHAELKRRILRLISRTRQSQERKYVKHAGNWSKFMYDGERLYSGPTHLNNEVWPLHWTMQLKKEKKMFVEQKHNLEEMHDMARKVKPMQEIICKLCSIQLHSVQEMRGHLVSAFHRSREQEIESDTS